MELKKAEEQDLDLLTTWLHTAEEAQIWGGPAITYPFDLATLKEQIQWSVNRSYSLVDDGAVVGFAQVAQRFGNNHLCRVLVDPTLRGQSLGEKLLVLIIAEEGNGEHKFSLFVYDSNDVAINLYHKLGFVTEPVPVGVTKMADCSYMVR
ncbi:MAG: ribosomal protein S18 acetylase RimI-like enzyme [Candidatus Krumholzibacteriia bacterium]|jgi:ribosomal protein S18 acetylase RimI-like enzyme